MNPKARFWSLIGLALGLFALSTALAMLAFHWGRPVTTAMVYLFGVVAVAALQGVRGGIVAALAASVIYNLFLSDPFFRFTLTSAEDLVPLLAFNLSAIASGLLAGRLKDRARAAESASHRIQALFEVSNRLQSAVRLEDIVSAARPFIEADVEIYVMDGDAPRPVNGAGHLGLVERLLMTGQASMREGNALGFALSAPAGLLGVVVLEDSGGSLKDRSADVDAFVNLLSIAIERCLLLDAAAEAELIRRSESFKTSLLSSVSHDMRTPLSAISASATSLSRFSAELSEETKVDLLDMIVEQCGRLDRYTGNLLSLTRLQAGVDGSQLVTCDAIEVLGSAILRARNVRSGHEIEKNLGAGEAIVRADPVMLEQVFYNVLENAVRYSPPQSRIFVEVAATELWLEIAISDCGPGIPAADLSRVFDRFYRSAASQAKDGSGLGLSIAKGFTEAFGGWISAENVEGAGTRIRIALPIDRHGDA